MHANGVVETAGPGDGVSADVTEPEALTVTTVDGATDVEGVSATVRVFETADDTDCEGSGVAPKLKVDEGDRVAADVPTPLPL